MSLTIDMPAIEYALAEYASRRRIWWGQPACADDPANDMHWWLWQQLTHRTEAFAAAPAAGRESRLPGAHFQAGYRWQELDELLNRHNLQPQFVSGGTDRPALGVASISHLTYAYKPEELRWCRQAQRAREVCFPDMPARDFAYRAIILDDVTASVHYPIGDRRPLIRIATASDVALWVHEPRRLPSNELELGFMAQSLLDGLSDTVSVTTGVQLPLFNVWTESGLDWLLGAEAHFEHGVTPGSSLGTMPVGRAYHQAGLSISYDGIEDAAPREGELWRKPSLPSYQVTRPFIAFLTVPSATDSSLARTARYAVLAGYDTWKRSF